MSPMVQSPLNIEYALLGLVYEKSRYGYEIFQEISQPTGLGLVWRIKQSQLYALLERLEAEGRLISEVEFQENRPPRKIFSLTTSGREVFLHWIQSPVQSPREMRMEFQAKLYFASQYHLSYRKLLIQAQEKVCESWLKSLNQEVDNLESRTDFDRQIFQYRIFQVRAILNWLKKLLEITSPESIRADHPLGKGPGNA